MSTPTGCGACPPLPEAFVRLRYFFGKRLGVADLNDEQAYHRGKQRLHNRLAHGRGVLCGLRLSPFSSDSGNTVLRVGAGAALDSCGDEVVVGHDQCIDLAAWFRRQVNHVEGTGESFPPAGSGDALRVCVVLRYRECPTTPEAAPRDPCSCDTGGCEYGRIQEGFELDVVLTAQARELDATWQNPSAADLADVVQSANDAASLAEGLGQLVTEACAQPLNPDWLVLGCLELQLEDGQVTGLSDPSDWSGPAQVLLSTSTLQTLLLKALEPGSAVVSADLHPTGDYQLVLAGTPLPGSLSGGARLRRLDPGGWVEDAGATAALHTVGPDTLLAVTPGDPAFAVEGVYQLSFGSPPLLTADLTPLQADLVFRVVDDGGTLTLTDLRDLGGS